MRKNLLLSVALASCATLATAQTLTPAVMSDMKIANKMEMLHSEKKQVASKSQSFHFNVGVPVLKAAGDAAYYIRPEGTYRHNLVVEGDQAGSVLVPSAILVGGYGDWVFRNVSKNVTGSAWSFQSKPFDQFGGSVDSEGNGILPLYPGGFTETPLLTVGKASYSYGNASQKWATFVSFNFQPMTYAQAYIYEAGRIGTSNRANPTTGDPECWLFGTRAGNRDVVNVTAQYEKPQSVLFVKDIKVNLISKDGEMPLTGDQKLTLTIYKIVDGEVTEEVIAQSTAGVDDLTSNQIFSNLGGHLLKFKFERENPDSGLLEEVGVTLNDAHAVVITGFDQPGVDCGVISYVNDDRNGRSTYCFMEDGELYNSYWIYDDKTPMFDMGIVFDAVMPCLVPQHENFANLLAPDAGGEASCNIDGKDYPYAVLYSSTPVEENGVYHIQIDAPDWIEVEYGYPNEEEAYNGDLALICRAEALPADVSGRVGEVKLSTYAGVTKTIYVNQGATSISSITAGVVKVTNNNGNFDLTYPIGMTSVEVMNASGQLVANYSLSGTSFSIPTASMSDGLYILKFNGESASTVKVMK